MHKLLNSSPVIGYKIALVNHANLNEQFVTIGERKVQQWERASIRQLRAIRKARLIAQSNRAAMLFGERKDGTHFPISFRKEA